MSNDVQLDVSDLAALLREASEMVALLDQLEEVPADVDMGNRRRMDPRKAEINHALLHLQTLLSTASGEAGMLYWAMRGRRDPRQFGAASAHDALRQAVESANAERR